MAEYNKTSVRFCKVRAMPKVSQEHLDARRAEILEGARRAFAQHGYDGATVAKLEEEIGLSRGAIFHYFDGKLDLFAAARERGQRALPGAPRRAGARRASSARSPTADPNWLNVLIETEVKLLHDPEFQKRITSTPEQRQTVLGAFERGQASGEFRDDIGADDLARFTAIVINGLALARLRGRRRSMSTPLQTLVNDARAPARLASPGEDRSLHRRGPEPAAGDRARAGARQARRRGRPERRRARARDRRRGRGGRLLRRGGRRRGRAEARASTAS